MPYRYYKPKDKISQLSKYFDLLDALFHKQQGYSEDELLHYIDSTKGTNTPDPGHIFNTLINFGLIIESSDLKPRYILGLPYRALLEHLYQDSQPVSSAVIKGYIDALKQCMRNLQKAYDDKSVALTLKHLQRLAREMDSISQTSARNRLGVINEVRKLRLNEDQLSYKQRLAEANRLWDEYLEPLREMIAPTGSFGEMMQQLKQTLDQGKAQFSPKIALRHQFVVNRTYRIQLQEQARHDLKEASAELDPLREKLIKESRLLEATSLLFDHLEQGKLKDYPALSLGRQLSREREVNLYGLSSWLADLWSIESEPESFHFDEDEVLEPEPLETEALLELLAKMPTNTDLIDYFQQQFSNLSANEILRAISVATLHQSDFSIDLASDDNKQYHIGGEIWQGSSFQKITEVETSE